MVAGHGLDIVDITDFSRLLHEPTSMFLDRHFTEAERRDAGEGVNQSQKLAGRFAVNEAVMKALDVGWGDGISSIVVIKSKLNNRRILAQSGAFLLFGLEADVEAFPPTGILIERIRINGNKKSIICNELNRMAINDSSI